MPVHQLGSVSNYLTFAKSDFVLSTFAAAVLSAVSYGETTLEMTNRIYDRYFCAQANLPSRFGTGRIG